jgi:hypothetical protein
MEKTYHVAVERANRVQNIIDQIGIGQVVKEKFANGCYTCITDTGVTLIKSADKLKLVTMYVTTYKELVAVYNGPKKIPPYLRKKVDHNQSLFTKAGKTIWG